MIGHSSPGDDIGLFDKVWVEDGAGLSGPLFQLGQLVDEENSGSLRLAARLHDPGSRNVSRNGRCKVNNFNR